jgi:DNA polymerase III gamma/tau subunit
MATKKPVVQTPDPEENSLHRKYRPDTIERVIGQEAAVTRIKGMIKTDKIPNAIAFFGPVSSGKTTIARCLAAAVNEKPVMEQQDWKELNAAAQRSIDDVRELERISKFRPMGSKRRFILIDEAQQFMSNAPAAQGLLKPVEEPSSHTTWIFGSSEPEKFQASNHGRALLSRCSIFNLSAPTEADMLKYAIRIAKGEKLTYLLDDDRELLRTVVRSSDSTMRTLAQRIQELQQFYDGLDGKKPALLTPEALGDALASMQSNDDKLAIDFLIGLFNRELSTVHLALMDVQDSFAFVKKVQWGAKFLMNVKVLKGQKHKSVWWNDQNKKLHADTKEANPSLTELALVNARITKAAAQAMAFNVSPVDMLQAEAFELIQELKK